MTARHIALVGMMGCGKSAIGRFLAIELGREFIDTDAAVVERHGEIAAIFSAEGEAAFRAYERDAVDEALSGPPKVVALGGGALTHAPTLAIVRARAFRIYIDVPVAVLFRRVVRGRVVRPMLGEAPSLERVRALLREREPVYREADLIVRGARPSKEAFAREIAAQLRERRVAS